MAINKKILKIALKCKPNFVCIVPEKRKEITTEGGLNVKKNFKPLKNIIYELKKNNIRTSLFIDPNIKDIELSQKLNVDCIELHTGKLSRLIKNKKNYDKELSKIMFPVSR